jgi:hypothetical protein
MNSILVATIVFGSALGGAIFGLFLQLVLPEKYFEHQTKEVVRLGTGLIATMAALVLGLLVSTAKSSFDEEVNNFRQLSLNFVVLDRTLANYGQDAGPARAQLKRTIAQTVDSLWPERPTGESSRIDDVRITAEGSALVDAIRGLSPHDESQQTLKSASLQLCTELMRDRWRLSQKSESSLPLPFLVVLAFWLAVLFGSFGLFSPRNALAFAALVVCAASVAGAVFLIVDLDQPFDGLVKVSSSSLRDAFSKLGK